MTNYLTKCGFRVNYGQNNQPKDEKMSNKNKEMNTAAKEVKAKSKTANKKAKTSKSVNWKKVWHAMGTPFRYIAKLARRAWNWVSGLNIVALANITLLVAIIVLFSILIMNILGCRKQAEVVVAQPVNVTQNVEVRNVVPRPVVLPVAGKKVAEPVNIVPVKKSEVQIAKRHIAKQNKQLMGDVVIDSRGAGRMLESGMVVNGNLYLQDMHKYTLPCDVRVNGSVFLRDLGLLQFCGDFTITGNIYVSPRSSFGPIPRTARLGGRVIL